MASLRAPGLGPIVGHTSHSTCRIWMRAGDPGDSGPVLDEDRRTVGVIGLVASGKRIGRAWYFRLQREYDRTGTFVLGNDVQLGFYPSDYADQGKPVPVRPPREAVAEPLTPDTLYTVRVGTLTVDDPTPNAALLKDWQLIQRLPDIDRIKNELLGFGAGECEAVFRTFPDPGSAAPKMSFLLGSCRYPGLLWKVKEADRIFAPMLSTSSGRRARPARFSLMVGDQIYADLLNRHGAAGAGGHLRRVPGALSSTAFGSPNMRKLLAHGADLHDPRRPRDRGQLERRIGWPTPGRAITVQLAIGAYMSYQWSHGPRDVRPHALLRFRACRLSVLRARYAHASLRGATGTDRASRTTTCSASRRAIPSYPSQLDRLLSWLTAQQQKRGDAPKFIVIVERLRAQRDRRAGGTRGCDNERRARNGTSAMERLAGRPFRRRVGATARPYRGGKHPERGVPVRRHPLLERGRAVVRAPVRGPVPRRCP